MRVLLVLGAAGSAAACGEAGAPARDATTRAAGAIAVGRAAAALDQDGKFVLAGGPSGERAEIDHARAVSLARAWVHDYARLASGVYERDHRGQIGWERLDQCGRAFYVRSQYATPEAVPEEVRKLAGPWWLTSFCDGSGPALSVAVSAYATDLEARSGLQQLPTTGDGNFIVMGIPIGVRLPNDPEPLAAQVASATGRRISEVPTLHAQALGVSPQFAVWRMVLDAPVRRGNPQRNSCALCRRPVRVNRTPTRRRRQANRSIDMQSDYTRNAHWGGILRRIGP